MMSGDPDVQSHLSALVPRTSPRFYLSGYTALNIPSPEGTGGDWHQDTALLHPSSRFDLAGEGTQARVNTFALLGEAGIHECGEVLRRMGVNVARGEAVYAANHYRAIVDLLVGQARSKGRLDLLDPAELLDDEEHLTELSRWLDHWQIRATPTEAAFIRSWRTRYQL